MSCFHALFYPFFKFLYIFVLMVNGIVCVVVKYECFQWMFNVFLFILVTPKCKIYASRSTWEQMYMLSNCFYTFFLHIFPYNFGKYNVFFFFLVKYPRQSLCYFEVLKSEYMYSKIVLKCFSCKLTLYFWWILLILIYLILT